MNDIISRAQKIKMLLMDCDGVLTDGLIYFSNEVNGSRESVKAFHIHDGLGIKLAVDAGLILGIITGRESDALKARAHQLKVKHIYQDIADKLKVYEKIKEEESLTDDEIAYMGDDLPDYPILRKVGLAIAVSNAVEEIRNCAHYVTTRHGGGGAVREAIELILKSQNKWPKN